MTYSSSLLPNTRWGSTGRGYEHKGIFSCTARAPLAPTQPYISTSGCWVSTNPKSEQEVRGALLKIYWSSLDVCHCTDERRDADMCSVLCLCPKLQEGQLVVCQFQFLRWSAYRDVPDSKKAFLNLLAQVHKWQRECGEGRTVVHCLWVTPWELYPKICISLLRTDEFLSSQKTYLNIRDKKVLTSQMRTEAVMNSLLYKKKTTRVTQMIIRFLLGM